jgi:succinate-semialdehyde dehydrogenase/glutarate-semialdehyde dehydrogenase
MDPFDVINPATGVKLRSTEPLSARELRRVLDSCPEAFASWSATDLAWRGELLRRAATLLRERRSDLARLMAEEMGKPVAQGEAEAEKCAWVCDFYADQAGAFLEPASIDTEAGRSYALYRPLGTVLAVMPWNFPLWQVFRFAAPALMAGNTCLLKHASNVPGCARAIEGLLHEAGVPLEVFHNLLLPSASVARVIRHPAVCAVTLTGSTPAGRAVAAAAGKALKKTVLELGGSDPYVVLADADLEAAAKACVTSRLINSGQSCIAAKRFIVEQPVMGPFQQLFLAGMDAARMGNPLDPATEVGPLARLDLRAELHRQVERSREAGATCLLGGEVPKGPGAFYPPTVLTGVRPGMPCFDEELFGPVAALVEAKDEEDAIRLANASRFGLGAAVFTSDPERGEQIAAERLEAGSCFVNDFVKSDPRLPFGGIKESGYGRELGPWGIREFVNVKTVYVR